VSTLTDIEKRYLEKILGMGGGYVLDYTDATFDEFFRRYRLNIHAHKYQTKGTSKAKKLRSFWEQESDALVGHTLSEFLDAYEAHCDLNGNEVEGPVLEKARDIAARLLGKRRESKPAKSVEGFLHQEFVIPNIHNLPLEQVVVPIIETRLDEVRKTLGAGAHLSVVMLCGSILEAVLLGKAQREPALFNKSPASPKTPEGKVKPFQDWTLAAFIDVASDVGVLKPDVQKFSHGLRDFRNYIHPYQQLVSCFTPDEHTAKVCFQVLKAALASVAGERR
jgi:hypothetical protein